MRGIAGVCQYFNRTTLAKLQTKEMMSQGQSQANLLEYGRCLQVSHGTPFSGNVWIHSSTKDGADGWRSWITNPDSDDGSIQHSASGNMILNTARNRVMIYSPSNEWAKRFITNMADSEKMDYRYLYPKNPLSTSIIDIILLFVSLRSGLVILKAAL